ncbi:MAG: response regulator [Candidatus Daviesbacteria bacterium]|nr:response regulator [Candidatus Daviesbacteria bacterium]
MQPKALIIEDEQFIRDIYKRQLEKSGISVVGFGNGKDGIESTKHTKYDIILLDVMLPDLNGLEILKQLKQSPETKDILVILLTNLGQDEVIKEAFTLGAQGYFIKASYTPDQIAQEVKNILARKPQAN